MNNITITLLFIIAIFHVYWAFGGKVGLDKALPTKDGKLLFNPGKIAILLVAMIIFSFSFVVFQITHSTTSNFYIYAGWIISAIFALRVIGDFNVVGLFKKVKETEFANYDTKFFVPLCIYLSVSIALLVYSNSN